MYDFNFTYSDGNTYRVKGVTKVIIPMQSGSKEVSGDEILNAKFPLKTMHLYSSTGNVTVSGNNLMVIDILKENT